MVSLPDELLRLLDAEAARRGTTRSGLLRDFADQSLRRRAVDRATRVDKIARAAGAHGGDVAAVLKRHRPAGGTSGSSTRACCWPARTPTTTTTPTRGGCWRGQIRWLRSISLTTR
ncbi:MAG: ribbon-helix-helix protein, CopG family [Solirubrobacteraceae bacterium]